MKVKNILKIFSIVQIITLFSLMFFSIQSLASSEIEITDFDDFVICNNDPYFISNITTNELSIEYLGDGTDFMINESVYLDLSGYGTIFDFDFEITISYLYDDVEFGRAEAVLGSYYSENGMYSGTPLENLGKWICSCSFSDAWSGYLGRYNLAAFPYDSMNKVNTERILGKNGNADFTMSRDYGTINCNVVDLGVISLSENWNGGLTKPLNYLSFRLEVYPEWTNIAYVTFSNISLRFVPVEGITTIIFPIDFLAQISFLLISVTIIIFRRQKKKNN
ncbi:MAG: hypothetical protein ACTSSK_13775 [Candidatus Heimdallarchaeota archaeon]